MFLPSLPPSAALRLPLLFLSFFPCCSRGCFETRGDLQCGASGSHLHHLPGFLAAAAARGVGLGHAAFPGHYCRQEVRGARRGTHRVQCPHSKPQSSKRHRLHPLGMTWLSSASLCYPVLKPCVLLFLHCPPMRCGRMSVHVDSLSGRHKVLSWTLNFTLEVHLCLCPVTTGGWKRTLKDFANWKSGKCYLLSWNTCHAQSHSSHAPKPGADKPTPDLLRRLYSVNINIGRAS